MSWSESFRKQCEGTLAAPFLHSPRCRFTKRRFFVKAMMAFVKWWWMILQLLFSIRRGYVFKLFFSLSFFLLGFHSSLFSFFLSPPSSAFAKKFISFSKSLSTRNQFSRDGFKFHISDIEETSGLGFLLSSSLLNVPSGNWISFYRYTLLREDVFRFQRFSDIDASIFISGKF